MRSTDKIRQMGQIFADFKRRRETLRARPFRLWIETAACCNLRCVMCPNKELRGDQKGLMSLELFRKIIAESRHFVSDVYLHHRGEPLLNPALFEMIQYANAAGVKTRFHTNGTLLDEEKALRLLKAGPDLVSFSVDGFTPETYENVRIGAKFTETVDNILRLVTLRQDLELKKPYVVIEKIRFKDPQREAAPRAVKALRDRLLAAGVDEIIEKAEYVWAGESAPEIDAGQRRLSACTFPWYAMVICWDGTVTPCPQDFMALMNLGNVHTASLQELWNGPAYRQLRRQMAADLPSLKLCHKCDRLARKTVGGVPFQYMLTFLTDHLLGYGKIRKWVGTQERN